MKRAPAIALLAALTVPSAARAAVPRPLRFDLAVDGSIAGAGTLFWVLTETLAKPSLAPRTCRVCGTDETHTIETVNGLDRMVRNRLAWSDKRIAGPLSSGIAFGAMPAAAILTDLLSARHYGNLGLTNADLILLVQTVSLAAVVNQTLKFWVGRERPFVHALGEDAKLLTAEPADNNLSFYSGHTSFTMSIAVAAGTIAWMRGYPAAPWIFGIGIPLSLFVGYLRVAADMHYFTDVIVGALIGAALGFGVPYLFHRWQPGDAVEPGLTPPNAGIAFQF